MAADPVYTTIPATGLIQISTANTNRDGTTGTYASGFVAGTTGVAPTSNGALVKNVIICSPGTTTAGVVRIYYNNATNRRLIREVLVPAVTPSTTIEAYTRDVPLNILVEQGHSIDFSTHNAEPFNCATFAEYL